MTLYVKTHKTVFHRVNVIYASIKTQSMYCKSQDERMQMVTNESNVTTNLLDYNPKYKMHINKAMLI